MKVLDFNKIEGFPYEEREKNILYNSEVFKIRVINLPGNGTMPECEMTSHVVFYVIEGNVEITVNGKVSYLSENQSLVSEPAIFSMKTQYGAKLMGIQIQKGK